MRLLLTTCMLAVLACAPCAGAFAAPIKVETTPIPRDRKPDFSSMNFLNGTWNCSVMSSRRPRAFGTTATTAVSPNGYWMTTRTVTGKVPWNPITITNQDYVTYDPSTSRWVDISMDDYGAYDISTSPGWNGKSIVWTDVAYPRSHATAVTYPRSVTKLSDRKTVSSARFKEPSGRLVTVKTVCTKV